MPWSIAVAVERRVDLDVDVAAERDQPDLDVGVDLVDEVAGRLLGRVEAGRVDVVGLHRQRHVEQHEDAALARACARSSRSTGRAMATTPAVRPSSWTPATTWRRQPRPRRRDLVEQVDLGEADGAPAAPALHDDVGDGEARRR